MARYEMVQPNGVYITIDTCGESASAYTKEDFQKNPELRGLVQASIYIHFGYGSYRCPREITKTLYWDDKGFYTYAKQKVPFYYWESQNIEEDYENWTKDKNGYHVPINEPRKLKKNIFSR